MRFLAGGGEAGRFIRTYDWSAHILGSIDVWPTSLLTSVGIVLQTPIPMILFWGKERSCFFNDAFCRGLALSELSATGEKAPDVLPDFWDSIAPAIEKVSTTGERVVCEDQLVSYSNGGHTDSVYWTLACGPVYDDVGVVNGTLVTCIEPESRVKEVRAREYSNQRFDALVSQASVGIIVLLGKDMVVDIVNDAYASLIGRTTSELMGEKLFDIIPEAEKSFREVLEAVRTAGMPVHLFEQAFALQSEQKETSRYFDIIYQPYVTNDNARGVIALCHDVTEKALARKKMQQSEERFEAAVQAVEGVVWTNSVHGEMLGEQPGWSGLTGQSYEEYQGYGWAAAVHPDDAQPTIDAWNDAVREKKIFVFRHRLKVKTGEYRMFSIRAIPLKNEDGSIREWVGVHTDITEHSQAEAILKESEERFRSLADNSPMIVYIVEPNAEASISYFNKTWLTYTGQSFHEALGRAWDGIVHPEDVQTVLSIYITAFHQRISYTLPAIRLKRHDGQYRWHLFKGTPRYLANGEFMGFVGVGIDIHEQKIMQEALQESESRFRNLADHAPMFIWMVDVNAVITYANRELLDFIGVNTETDVTTSGGWERVTHPEDLPNVYNAFVEGLSSRTEYKVEARLLNQGTKEYEWFLFKAAPKILEGGEFTGFIGTAVNIHQQKTLLSLLEQRVQLRTKELNIANEALLQSNEDLKQFAHVASHDLKEPVRKIQTFSHRLHDEFGGALAPRAQSYLHKIMRSTDRMSSMIDGVLKYSSINASEAKIERVELNSVIENIIVDLEVVIAKKNARITLDPLPAIEGSEVLLYQLFYNLINNSLKFSRRDTPPVVHIELRGSSTPDEVVIAVADNGIGFDKQYAERIFESFTRLNTKDQYEGTGLGLSLCKKIVQRHGGSIRAISQPGEGATFIMTLPMISRSKTYR